MVQFDDDTIEQGRRLADHLLKSCKRETPPAAVIASAMTLVVSAQAAGIQSRRHLIDLIQLLDDNLRGGVQTDAQNALSSLILPGG